MAGIYFHIPFCRKKCNYCDFYSKRESGGTEYLVRSEIAELISRKDYPGDEMIDTIYFGGGTPSLLNISQINDILTAVYQNFDVSDECEITFEANPDDLTEDYLSLLRQCNINRLSIGIQSFNDDILKFLGRRHDSSKIEQIIDHARKAGFSNISGDLIFAIPGMDFETYLDSLNKMVNLNLEHISAYSLTIEKGTYFYKLVQNSKLTEVSDEEMLRQFNTTMDVLGANGFVQYEISNYAREGFFSRHNSSYWNNKNYLGIGPSAHSYNQVSRQWNVSNTAKYCNHVMNGAPYFEIEYLTQYDRFNEYLITGLRMKKGISLNYMINNFDTGIIKQFQKEAEKLYESELINNTSGHIVLTRKGMSVADYIIRQLYIVK